MLPETVNKLIRVKHKVDSFTTRCRPDRHAPPLDFKEMQILADEQKEDESDNAVDVINEPEFDLTEEDSIDDCPCPWIEIPELVSDSVESTIQFDLDLERRAGRQGQTLPESKLPC